MKKMIWHRQAQQKQHRRRRQTKSWSCARMPHDTTWSSEFAAKWNSSWTKMWRRTGTSTGPMSVCSLNRLASSDLTRGLTASQVCRLSQERTIWRETSLACKRHLKKTSASFPERGSCHRTKTTSRTSSTRRKLRRLSSSLSICAKARAFI